jgi:8-oxo-dGTP pyrophosphatase MutT (NUDIX family)
MSEGWVRYRGAEGGRDTVPRKLAERAREIAAGTLTPAVPRDAATIILLRQGSGVEAYLLQRTGTLDFAPGACVFPGGSVDERDADPETGWAGPSPADFADQLGASAERARALVCAAVRETFEEAGVLLAGPSPTTLLDDSAALAQDRHALLAGSASFGELLSRRGLILRTDLLIPWARWITPEAAPRRFDTWFFAAAVPPGQTAGLASPAEHRDGAEHESPARPRESDSGTWLRPEAALESARAGEITLLPPTAVTLGELAAHEDVTGILAQRPVITPRLPRVMIGAEGAWLAVPPSGPQPAETRAAETRAAETQPAETRAGETRA